MILNNDFRMCLNWDFRKKTRCFNRTPALTPKSMWDPPKRHACLEFFQVKPKKTFGDPIFRFEVF